MPFMTDAVGSFGQQLGGMGANLDPSVLAQINAATRPASLTAGSPAAAPMQTPGGNSSFSSGQFNATPSSFSSGFAPSQGQFSAFGRGGENPNGPVGGYLAANMGNQPWQINSARSVNSFGGDFSGGGGGMATTVGGDWAALDAHNAEINAAATQYGVPANLLKSMINRESSGNWDANNYVYGGYRNDQMLPFVGIFRQTADSWGIDFDAMVGNKQAQINGMAQILQGLSNQYGGYDNAAKVYFGGEQALNGTFIDENGLSSDYYYQKTKEGWDYLDQQSGFTGNYDLPVVNSSQFGNNAVIDAAMDFVGTPYVWGAIPGFGDDPRQTGWDCSGFTYWLDQNYGDRSLPMGSHYQYQYAQQTGKLFQDTSQLQAGDLVFFDTGVRGGGGAELNNASHVGLYIGNGQILHAANPTTGTIVSDINAYFGMYPYLGAMHQSFSGGGGGFGGGGSSSQFYGKGSGYLDYLFG